MHDEALDGPAGVGHAHFPTGAGNAPDIGHLTTGLDVETGILKDDLDCLARCCLVNNVIALEQRDHAGLPPGATVGILCQIPRPALRLNPVVQHRVDLGVRVGLHFKGSGSAGTGALGFARGTVARLINREALFEDDIAGDLEGQAECVMEEEGLLA